MTDKEIIDEAYKEILKQIYKEFHISEDQSQFQIRVNRAKQMRNIAHSLLNGQ
jgi:hypothetical protein